MGDYVLGFREIDDSRVHEVGAKAARLAELSRIDGVGVPEGFCVTTAAFARMWADAPSVEDRLDRLSRLRGEDREAIHALGAEIRGALERAPVPHDVAEAITRALGTLGDDAAYAVRSSATAEDLPTASFAGQQDTYLNVLEPAVLRHVSRCWASLFTERAIAYRMRNGIDHRTVQMAVIVQRMVFPRAAGVLFTADPVTSDRKVVSVEAALGLGEGLVSGTVNADVYTVRDDQLVTRTIASKSVAIHAVPTGGTAERAIEPERRHGSALTDEQVVRLARLGRRIEAHFGAPQDVEWCLVGDGFEIVQSRPITTLFPIPKADDHGHHVYVSVGHQQMMTDAIRPLGISLWQLTAARPMYEAAGRLFVDVTRELASPTRREGLLKVLGGAEPLIGDALQTIIDRGDFIATVADDDPVAAPAAGAPASVDTDPLIVAELIERAEASLARVRRDIASMRGSALLDFIIADITELQRILFDPQSIQVIMAAMHASWWLREQLQAWLGEGHAVDTLTQSVPDNVTAEMGLALLDVADMIRPHPDVVAFLRTVEHEGFLKELPALPGGREAQAAIQTYLDMYGMRCVGEIDITRPRWSERPTTLVPIILGNVDNAEPGASKRRFEHGRQAARSKQEELLTRIRALPDGQRKADEAERMIDRLRTFTGYREFPKYGLVCRYFVYKQALLEEADRLAHARVIGDREDIFYLTLEELHEVVRAQHANHELIRRRRAAFRSYQSLTPPRVLTSDGEVLAGSYRRDDVPTGALVGLPVSAGAVGGRARVVLDIAQAQLQPGDILVTRYTDPSWTPLFVAAAALVTEIGGLMTHGAVIAREYGLPAVVGVDKATQLIRDGQWIRVHGTDGYVEIEG